MLKGELFDYVFSNFGGLNCQSDLSCITRELHTLLKPGGYVTWVVMPPVSLWELAWGFKGNWKQAGRRLSQNGATAHLEGEYFKTYYHSLPSIRQKFGTDFLLIQVESLGNFSPPPSHLDFADRHPFLYSFLKMLERVTGRIFPFNRFGDHLIATFQRKS